MPTTPTHTYYGLKKCYYDSKNVLDYKNNEEENLKSFDFFPLNTFHFFFFSCELFSPLKSSVIQIWSRSQYIAIQINRFHFLVNVHRMSLWTSHTWMSRLFTSGAFIPQLRTACVCAIHTRHSARICFGALFTIIRKNTDFDSSRSNHFGSDSNKWFFHSLALVFVVRMIFF